MLPVGNALHWQSSGGVKQERTCSRHCVWSLWGNGGWYELCRVCNVCDGLMGYKWLGGAVVRTLDLWLSVTVMTLPGYFWDRWPYFAGKLSWDIIAPQVNLALHPARVAKSSTSFGKGGKVTVAEWQVTLCDPIWHVISRSSEVISITNCYIRVYFTLLFISDVVYSGYLTHLLQNLLLVMGGSLLWCYQWWLDWWNCVICCSGQFFESHLKHIKHYDRFVPFTRARTDYSYLLKV